MVNLCILNTFTLLSTPVESLGVRVQFTATPLRAVDHRFVFPFLQRSESNGVRHERGNFGGSAVFVVRARRVHEGPIGRSAYSTFSFPFVQDTLGHEDNNMKRWMESQLNTTSVMSLSFPKIKSISSQVSSSGIHRPVSF